MAFLLLFLHLGPVVITPPALAQPQALELPNQAREDMESLKQLPPPPSLSLGFQQPAAFGDDFDADEFFCCLAEVLVLVGIVAISFLAASGIVWLIEENEKKETW